MFAQFATIGVADPWKFQPHPEVWALVVFLIGAYIYMIRVIGPRAVPAGQLAVSHRQVASFVGAIALLWFGADWPVHDIGENYLYSVHMFQHMIFSYFVPPLALMATPEWMWRALVGTGRFYRVTSKLAKPIVAGVIFNVVVMVTHVPGVVNAATTTSAISSVSTKGSKALITGSTTSLLKIESSKKFSLKFLVEHGHLIARLVILQKIQAVLL